MNKRLLYLLSALLILLFSVEFTGAASLKPKPGQRPRPVKLFTGNFINPSGQAHRIQVVDGGHINISNEQEGLYYRLYARTGEDGTAEITIKQYLDAEFSVAVHEESLNVPLNGRAKRSSMAPFQISLDGVQRTRAEFRPGPPPNLNKSVGGACCISCGDGWVVCCGVEIYEAGWLACCSIETWCATCDVCAWWAE